jgi:hypothetical protein
VGFQGGAIVRQFQPGKWFVAFRSSLTVPSMTLCATAGRLRRALPCASRTSAKLAEEDVHQ